LSDISLQCKDIDIPTEIVVVDASAGRLDEIRNKHMKDVRWVDFQQPPGIPVSIPHQRNVGVKSALGDIIVFTDAGCHPEKRWLRNLVQPLLDGEHVAAGPMLGTPGGTKLYDGAEQQFQSTRYLRECGSGNLAFRRAAYEAVGGFDETLSYGSDVDFSWRLTDAGYRLRSVPGAIIRHDWGTRRRQLRRSYVYGKARIRLYRKHSSRRRYVLRNDPMLVAYPAFILGLPLTVIFPLYPALLLIPAWRNRSPQVLAVLVDHLMYGAGALRELTVR
jgi:GT2 family glycosyltransferase